jgi:hypothetical protein
VVLRGRRCQLRMDQGVDTLRQADRASRAVRVLRSARAARHALQIPCRVLRDRCGRQRAISRKLTTPVIRPDRVNLTAAADHTDRLPVIMAAGAIASRRTAEATASPPTAAAEVIASRLIEGHMAGGMRDLRVVDTRHRRIVPRHPLLTPPTAVEEDGRLAEAADTPAEAAITPRASITKVNVGSTSFE